MDLASGYSDNTNYGNGYTPLATGAINNNNAEYARNQVAMALMAQDYNPYANSGGSFGAMPAAYAGAGAAYGRAVGGGGNIYASPGGGGGDSYSGGGIGSDAVHDPYRDWLGNGGYNQGGIGSDAVGAPNQPGVGVNWDKYFSDATGNQQPAPGGNAYAGYDYYSPGSFGGQGGWGGAPANPDMYKLLGYTPQQLYSSGGIGSDAVRDPYQDWLKTGGYNAQPQQPNSLPPFWQGVRDLFGADPKDQSRVPQSDGGYPGATNPNYQPGGMTPQQPVPFRDTWTNAS